LQEKLTQNAGYILVILLEIILSIMLQQLEKMMIKLRKF